MMHPSEAISAFLDGELSGGELTEVLNHVGSCGRCSAELEDLQRVRSAVRALPVLELPAGLVPEAEREEPTPLHNRGLWVGAAAAVIALVITLASLLTPPPPTISVDDLSSRFGARVSLDPAFGPAKVVVPQLEGQE